MHKSKEDLRVLVLSDLGGSTEKDSLVVSLLLENLNSMYSFDYVVDSRQENVKVWVSKHLPVDTSLHFYSFDYLSELSKLPITKSMTLIRTLYNSDLCDYYSSRGIRVVNVSPYNDCVDIIMPVYNSEKTLKASIESVLSQTHSNFKLILVDDGSFDRTSEIAKSFLSDTRVVYLQCLHRGISSSLNYGISESSGDLIARQDADDLWMPWHLDLLLVTFKLSGNIDLLGSRVFINLNEKPRNPVSVVAPSISGERLWLDLAYSNVFNHSTMLFKRSVFEEAGGYNSGYDGYEDWHLWYRMVTKTNAMIVDLATVYYHVVNKNEQQMIFLSRLAKSRGLRLKDIL